MHGYFRIANELDRLLKSTLPFEQWNARLAKFIRRIRGGDPRARVVLFQRLKNAQDAELASRIVFILRQLDDPKILRPLLEIVRDPSVTDEVKIELLPLFIRYDTNCSLPHLAQYFKDPQLIPRTLVEWLLEGVAKNEEAIVSILTDLRRWDRASQKRWLGYLETYGGERALPLLAAVAESEDAELARMALAGIARIPSGRSLFVLENLFNHRETFRGEIESALRKLRAAGLTSRPLFVASDPVRECWLTPIDGYGSQILMIARGAGSEGYDVALFALNERAGIKECLSARGLPAREYRRAVAAVSLEVPIASVSYDYARALVRDALFVARRHRVLIPPEFAVHRWIFGGDDLSPQEYRPTFPKFLLAEMRRQQAELLATSDRLLESFPFSDWWIDRQAAYDFVLQRGLHRGDLFLPLTRKELLDFVEEILEPERELFGRRLALTAESLLYSAHGQNSRAPVHLWKTTLALWSALQDRRRSLRHIPFFIELARMTVAQVRANIRMGCRASSPGESS